LHAIARNLKRYSLGTIGCFLMEHYSRKRLISNLQRKNAFKLV
jgi:hypothetical protein